MWSGCLANFNQLGWRNLRPALVRTTVAKFRELSQCSACAWVKTADRSRDLKLMMEREAIIIHDQISTNHSRRDDLA
jgi:hypothetical protein